MVKDKSLPCRRIHFPCKTTGRERAWGPHLKSPCCARSAASAAATRRRRRPAPRKRQSHQGSQARTSPRRRARPLRPLRQRRPVPAARFSNSVSIRTREERVRVCAWAADPSVRYSRWSWDLCRRKRERERVTPRLAIGIWMLDASVPVVVQ